MPGLLEDTAYGNQATTKPSVFAASSGAGNAAGLPAGIVLGEDGKPCRTCTSSAAWKTMMKSTTRPFSTTKPVSSQSTALATQTMNLPLQDLPPTTITTTLPDGTQCPPDVDELGRSTWTLLHTLPTTYPTQPTPQRQSTTFNFLQLFSQLYPCHACATDFREYLVDEGGDLKDALRTQEGFGRWMCRAHNAVNKKLGKEEFDCNFWRRRWVDGPSDGGCG